MKRERKYHGCGEEYNVETRGSNIIFPVILRLLKKYQVGQRGRKKIRKFAEKNKSQRKFTLHPIVSVINSILIKVRGKIKISF